LRSAICSGRAALQERPHLERRDSRPNSPHRKFRAGARAAPNAVPEVKGIRCSTGCIGAEVRSKPPSEPTPEPRPISSMGGMIARGTADSAAGVTIPPVKPPLPEPDGRRSCPASSGKTCNRPRAHERLTNRVAREIVDKLRTPEAHFDFCGMHVDVHFVVRHFQKKERRGENRGRQNIAIGFVNGVEDQPVAHQAAITKI